MIPDSDNPNEGVAASGAGPLPPPVQDPQPAPSAAAARPKQRGNVPLPVAGAMVDVKDGKGRVIRKEQAMRIPDEHDVVLDGKIIGRDPDPAKRKAILDGGARRR